ncbi:MAG: hypothetical protein PWQ42_780 [Sulfurospirillum sp.]|jgi:hypothetical protein|nr:hypothetical protein [Sulfurospirillum sp.]
MRRSSTDTNYLRLFFLSISFLFLLIMGSLYTWLPSFVGLFFIYVLINFEDEKNRLYLYLSFLYLIFYDINRGFYLFSYIFTFLIFYNFFLDKVRNYFSCINCILVMYVLVAYIGHYFMNVFIAYLLNETIIELSKEYIYYILIDMVLASIIFKGRV